MDEDLTTGVMDTAARVVGGGAISANGHGNVSLRAPDGDEMYFTTAPTLNGLDRRGIARIGLDGAVREGELPPIQGAVVSMHAALYEDHPEARCVIHTHSPFATAFAVARREVACWIEAMAMFGLADGVPLADYAPRGSDQAIANIRAALRPGVPAVLLANHGVLVFHRTPDLAVLVGGVVEEAARAAITAGAIGGPVEIPAEMRTAAFQRAMSFEAAGTATA